ncbi:MAG: AMP-binding protein [Dysgonamonadaceae bacterium]|jgi:fatty-acyl-CoA synthase|nr:AMP-binding protein [Dysgonamonadaceae bacterium]
MKNEELSERTLGDWLEYWADTTPDNEFLVYSDRDLRFSWKQFNDRVDNMAKGLIAIGVKKDDKVGIWATNVPDWLTFLYAVAKTGAVAVTVNTNYKQHELEFLVKDADIHTLCITEGVFDGSYIDMVYAMLPEMKNMQRGYLHSDNFPFLKNVVFIGQEKYRGMYNTVELLLLGQNIDDEVLERQKKMFNCYDVVNMQYTSGTTGFPKGVMLTHHNITNNGYFTGEGMHFTQADKLCCCVPLFHCFGVVLASMNVLTHGCTQVMVERFDPLLVLASIHKERCTALYGVPTMFIAELNHPMFHLFDVSSLRTGIMAGSLCPIELMRKVTEKLHITHITSVYGLTESSPGMTHSVIEDDFEARCTTVGKEYPFTEVKVLHPETGEECPAGIQGEMCCRGYLVMKAYYKNPQATSEVIDKNGWLHSGDLGIKDEKGYYHITGRIKDMIIRGGENIYPREIEEFLYHLPGVRDVQVAAVPSEKYGEEVGAFIITEEGVKMTAEDVRDFCRGQIARHKIPKYVFFVDTFPMTGSGKIQKYKLKDLALKLCKEQDIQVI